MALSEKELAAATFIAVTALAKRLTGADICVTLEGQDGRVRSLIGSDGHVTWIERGADLAAHEVDPEVLVAARQRRPRVLQQVFDTVEQPV